MSVNATTISTWALLIAKALEDFGLESRLYFREAGMDPEILHDPNARYPIESLQKLWRLSVDATNDSSFGLKVSSHWHPTTFHALGYAWMASGDLREAMERAVRYSKIVNDLISLSLDKANGAYRFNIGYSEFGAQPVPESIDAGLSAFVIMARSVYGEEINPVMVMLPREKPDAQAANKFNEFYRSPIEYEADECSLFFIEEEVEKPLSTANAELAHANDSIIKTYIAHLDRSQVSMQVKAKLIDHLSSGNITEQQLASATNFSLRSLQRKLKDEGTSFKAILDDTRRELAGQYIKNSRLSISEITFLLGFSEPSNFTRAFKRWNGVAPSDFRSSL